MALYLVTARLSLKHQDLMLKTTASLCFTYKVSRGAQGKRTEFRCQHVGIYMCIRCQSPAVVNGHPINAVRGVHTAIQLAKF